MTKYANGKIYKLVSNKSSDGQVKIIDFGLARNLDDTFNGTLGSFVGTPHYVAPEIFKGAYDLKCDNWSIGVILFTLLSGKHPF